MQSIAVMNPRLTKGRTRSQKTTDGDSYHNVCLWQTHNDAKHLITFAFGKIITINLKSGISYRKFGRALGAKRTGTDAYKVRGVHGGTKAPPYNPIRRSRTSAAKLRFASSPTKWISSDKVGFHCEA